MNKLLAKVLVSLASTLLCLALVEGFTRLMITRDADGDQIFRSLRLKPFHAPIEKTKALLDLYEKNKASTVMTYDSDLGWRPTSRGSNGNIGEFVSTRPNPEKTPQPGCLRIELFGGSYTRGGPPRSWWRVLDQKLAEKGVRAEVLNFGVAGYAMDQAYLRWKKDGAAYHPDIVIFGFSAGNMMDNVNVLRLLQNPQTGIPFTKPRFIFDCGALKLVNSPTVPPGMLLQHVADLGHWPLLKYEYYYNPVDYQPRWWEASRLLALIAAKRDTRLGWLDERRHYQMDEEPAQLTMKIIGQFRDDVERSGGKFLVIHLPSAPELQEYRATGKFSFAGAYQALQQITPVIQTEQNLRDVIGKADPHEFFEDGHYTSSLHASIGATAADYIAARWGKGGE